MILSYANVSNGLTLSPQHVIKASFVQPRKLGLGVLDRVGLQSPGQCEALLSFCEVAACGKSGQPFINFALSKEIQGGVVCRKSK
jgi:hypothetical protein